MNEYFRHKNIFLLNNDILDENLFDSEFIDLIVTSPPYNVGIGGNRAVGANLTKIAQKAGLKFKSTIVWNEGNISLEEQLGEVGNLLQHRL